MLDIRHDESFYFSQNSLNTFKSCPLKFKMKYMEGLRWKEDSYIYDRYKVGRDFHLIAERYFKGIDTNLEDFDVHKKWLSSLEEAVPIVNENEYLSEFELKMKKGDLRLLSKYDLIVIRPDDILEIWDWKTMNKQISRDEGERRLQTIVYLYTIGENMDYFLDKDISYENICMYYWQPEFSKEPLKIDYSCEKHRRYENILENMIDEITSYDFEKDFKKNRYISSCKYCEFSFLCNG